MNTLIVIGYMGIRKCYLNISRAEAIERFTKDDSPPSDDLIDEFTFDDSFEAYDVWANYI